MSQFENFITKLCSKTGWKEPKTNKENHLFFTLIGKNGASMDLEFFTPDGSILVMEVKLLPLPQDEHQKNELLKDYGKTIVGACKKRPSVLTIDNEYILLYRKEKMQDMEKLVDSVGEFLKDTDWWFKKQDSSSSTPFNFFSNWGK